MFDENKYITKHLFQKRNLLFLLLIMIIFLIMFFCLTFSNTYLSIGNYMTYKKYGLRNLHVTSEDGNYESVSNIEHIIANVTYKEYGEIYLSPDDDFGKEIRLVSLLDDNAIDIIYGDKISKDTDIICNNVFYPERPIYNDNGLKLDNKKIINGKDVLKQTFKFKSLNSDINKVFNLNVVGTYDGSKLMDPLNTCYASPKLISDLRSKCNGVIISEVPGLPNEVLCEPYEGVVVRVDNIKNVDKVKKTLYQLGYDVFQFDKADDVAIMLFGYGPLIVLLFIILITILILDSFIKKKIIERKKQYGILKVIGFDDDKIVNMEVKENVILLVTGLILTFVLFIIGFVIIKINYLDEFLFEGFNLTLPFILIVIFIIVILLLFIKLVKNKIYNFMKKDIMDLLRE